MFKLAVFVALMAVAFAELKQEPGPGEKETHRALAKAQLAVNQKALRYNAGIGTAYYDGVPGALEGYGYGHPGYGYAHAPHYGGYGYAHPHPHGYYGHGAYYGPGPYYGGHYYGGYGPHY